MAHDPECLGYVYMCRLLDLLIDATCTRKVLILSLKCR